MNEQDIQTIIGQMTNYYHEHLPMDSSFARLLRIYGTMFDAIRSQLQLVSNGNFVEKTDMLTTIPYAKLDMSAALYDRSLATRLSLLTTDQQLAQLDAQGFYAELSFSAESVRIPIVYSMTLRQSFSSSDSLALYSDYFIRSNKIYFLPSFVLSGKAISSVMHALDIKVDEKRLERNWGTLYDLELGPLLPRFEYREVLKGFNMAMLSNLTIRDIRIAIKQVTNWDAFDLHDMLSPTLPASKKRLYDNWVLSPAQFIVSIPEVIISDRVRISLLAHLLEQIKASETNYVMFYDIIRTDMLTKYSSSFIKKTLVRPVENVWSKDIPRMKETFNIVDSMFDQEPFNLYDDDMSYGFHYNYDVDVLTSYDYYTKFENDSFDTFSTRPTDYFSVSLRSFPQIPRSFAGVRTATPGVYQFSCKPNTDGTTLIALCGSIDPYGTYDQLATFPNDQAATTLTMIYNANSSGKRYYKIMAIAGSSQSLLTLSIDVQLL